MGPLRPHTYVSHYQGIAVKVIQNPVKIVLEVAYYDWCGEKRPFCRIVRLKVGIVT